MVVVGERFDGEMPLNYYYFSFAEESRREGERVKWTEIDREDDESMVRVVKEITHPFWVNLRVLPLYFFFKRV